MTDLDRAFEVAEKAMQKLSAERDRLIKDVERLREAAREVCSAKDYWDEQDGADIANPQRAAAVDRIFAAIKELRAAWAEKVLEEER